MSQQLVKFCAEECRRQNSGEMSVYYMYDAWTYATICGGIPSVESILEIGRRVDPNLNADGYRTVAVRIGYSIKKVYEFDRMLRELCSSKLVDDPIEFFRQFEMIHPFIDGNGRTGLILYNTLLGTMDNPQEPPDLHVKGFFPAF